MKKSRILLPVGLALVVLLAYGWTQVRRSKEPDRRGSLLSEIFHFESLAQLAATSDLVAEGTVVDVREGRVVGPVDAPLQLMEVTLRVDRIWRGSYSSDEIILEDDGVSAGLSQVGDHGTYFLHLKTDSPKGQPYYRLLNSQARFLEVDGRITASNDDSSWVRDLEQLSAQEFKDRLNEALTLVDRGQVTPLDGPEPAHTVEEDS